MSVDPIKRIQSAFTESAGVKQAFAEQSAEDIARAVTLVTESFRQGGKVLLFGNGGSAADAQHLADEWVGRYRKDRPALPAIALTTNTSDLTAIGNDYGFEHVFRRGIEAHGRAGDIALAISTSGNSPNVLLGVETAKQQGMHTIGLLGKGGGKLAPLVDLPLVVPSNETSRIQESHITFAHILCELVEENLYPELRES